MYPVCLEISDKLCVVVGGGSVAERKVLGLLTAGAQVRIITPQLTRSLARLADDGRIEWLERGYAQGDLAGALLIFAATDSREVQKAVCKEAGQAGQLVNVIDAPARCSFHVPAVVQRGDLTLAVSTGGKSPAVAAMIRKQLAQSYGEEYGLLLDLISRLREQVLAGEGNSSERKILFQNILHDDIVHWIKSGQKDLLRRHLRAVLGSDVDFDISQPGRDT
ncbi:MAG: bifunctional precorrin-2 dehydrogenase/sirohydrochlorin ferrochelatase [Thermodesulfobacteriota bacterium]|nr:bifunctional precorrin-2 dehydrogenase/sirohydrochlorin ferrochelatase [Thermodesulfobacteriota bacterium]